MCVGRLVGQKDAIGGLAQCPTTTVPAEILKAKERTVLVLCYDCDQRSHAPFHYLGMECGHCRGFNTSRM
jgi:hypothetical protein